MEKSALIVIDAQQEYFARTEKVVLPNGPAAERIAAMLALARTRDVPVIHVVHESRRPGAAIFPPRGSAALNHPLARPAAGETVITKHMPGSFTGTPLEETLRKQGIERVVLRKPSIG